MDNKTVIAQKSSGFYTFYIVNFAVEVVLAVVLNFAGLYFGGMSVPVEVVEMMRIIYLLLWILAAVDICSIIYHGIVIIRHIMRKKDIVTYFGGTFTFNKTDISAGDTPEIRLACPMDIGLILLSFSRASSRRLDTSS